MTMPGKQQGAALIILLTIVVLGAAALLLGSLNGSELQLERRRATSNTLARAKEALIGDAVSQMPVAATGYLRLPDLGFKVGLAPSEGSAAPNFSGNAKDYSVIGKLPWRSLGLEPLRDGEGECLWYVVSGRFKNTPATDALNWDTPGQIDLADGNGNLIAGNLAALVASPGRPLDGQGRALSDPAYAQCGGNYDAQNYLDAYDGADALAGAVNYFPNTTYHRVASDGANKLLIMAEGAHYNDHFLAITGDEIFRAITRRADFSAQVSALLDDAYFRNVAVTGTKGSDGVNCGLLTGSNRAFCKNWKEMLLLTQLPIPSPVIIDGAPSAACSRVLLFGGRKTVSQRRASAADKASPANYIEGTNLSAFAAPIAVSGSFSGASAFDASDMSADLLRCLP